MQARTPWTPTQQDLWEHVVAMWELARQQDTARVRAGLHPDYSGWVTGSDAPHGRDAAVASVGPGTPRVARYHLVPLHVGIADDVGIVHYRYRAELDGADPPAQGRWTEIYRRDGKHWLMVAVSGGPDGQR